MSIIQGPASTVHFDGAIFEGDPGFLAEIVSLFLSTCPDLLSAVEDAVSRKDASALRRAAHTLKGSIASFGAKSVVAQAQTLEMIGSSGNLSGAEEGLRTLRDLVGEVLPELQAVLEKATRQQVDNT